MLFFGIIFPHCINSYPLSKWGLYGDAWGSINALASVAAFIGVLFSLHAQNKENDETRKKMTDTLDKQTELVNATIKQGLMNIRPYLNIYFDFDESHALVIKNVGKSACTNFSLKASYTLNTELNQAEKQIIDTIIAVINNYKLSIIPAGIEYAITFKITASFYFQEKKEEFSIDYEIDHYPTVRSKDKR